MATTCPPRRANPVIMLRAKYGDISKNSPKSTTREITSCMSYGLVDSGGTMRSSPAISGGVAPSSTAINGGVSKLFEGRYDSNVLINQNESSSFSASNCATPLLLL